MDEQPDALPPHDPDDLPEGVLHHVPHSEQIEALYGDLDAVIRRYGMEFRLPLASTIGVLEVLKLNVMERHRMPYEE